MASSSLRRLTVLPDEDDVPGSKFEREPEENTVQATKTVVEVQGLEIKQ